MHNKNNLLIGYCNFKYICTKHNIKSQINSRTVIAGSFNIALSTYTFFQQAMELPQNISHIKMQSGLKNAEKRKWNFVFYLSTVE